MPEKPVCALSVIVAPPLKQPPGKVGTAVGVGVAVAAPLGVGLAVLVGVGVAVFVAVGVPVFVAVGVAVFVGVGEVVLIGVAVTLLVGAVVADVVAVLDGVVVGCAVSVGTGDISTIGVGAGVVWGSESPQKFSCDVDALTAATCTETWFDNLLQALAQLALPRSVFCLRLPSFMARRIWTKRSREQ